MTFGVEKKNLKTVEFLWSNFITHRRSA